VIVGFVLSKDIVLPDDFLFLRKDHVKSSFFSGKHCSVVTLCLRM